MVSKHQTIISLSNPCMQACREDDYPGVLSVIPIFIYDYADIKIQGNCLDTLRTAFLLLGWKGISRLDCIDNPDVGQLPLPHFYNITKTGHIQGDLPGCGVHCKTEGTNQSHWLSEYGGDGHSSLRWYDIDVSCNRESKEPWEACLRLNFLVVVTWMSPVPKIPTGHLAHRPGLSLGDLLVESSIRWTLGFGPAGAVGAFASPVWILGIRCMTRSSLFMSVSHQKSSNPPVRFSEMSCRSHPVLDVKD